MTKKLAKLVAVIFSSGLWMLWVCSPANSADYPKKPIKIFVSSEVGSGEDTEARGLAPFLQKHLGVNILIENQGGAGGKIAFEKFQKAEPDGYSLLLNTFPKSIIIEYMGKVNYRTRDFTPIYAWSRMNQLLVVHGEGWKTFDEFLKTAKTKILAGGLAGRGSTTHLAVLIAMDQLGVKFNWVPYEGAGHIVALAGKHLDFTVCFPSTATSLIKSGKLRPLVLFSDERDPYLPNVPISKDFGFNITPIPAIRCAEAPPRTPNGIVKILEEAFSKTVKEPTYIEWAKQRYMVIHPLSAQELDKLTKETYSKVEQYQQMLRE
jgi:tripartite-type tricarboxylate transporter receptor subunit TctC